jgi:hypothetical protein
MTEIAEFLGTSPYTTTRLFEPFITRRDSAGRPILSNVRLLELIRSGIDVERPGAYMARPQRKIVGSAQRRRIIARDESTCRYCGKLVRRRIVIDHVLPVSEGGRNIDANLVVACEPCNSRKHRQTVEEAGMTLRPSPNGSDHLHAIQACLASGQIYAQYEPEEEAS